MGLLSLIVISSFSYVIYKLHKKSKFNYRILILEVGFLLAYVINDFIVLLLSPLNIDYFYYLNGPALVIIGIGALLLFYSFYNDFTLVYAISAKPDELLVIDKDGDLIYSYSFEDKTDVDYSMISKGLRGLATMIYEILESESDLENIIFSDRVLLATARENIIYALFTKHPTPSLRQALDSFSETFTAFIKNDQKITDKIGNILVDKIFNFSLITEE